MPKPLFYDALRGDTTSANVDTLRSWRDEIVREVLRPTNRTVALNNRFQTLRDRLADLDAVLTWRASFLKTTFVIDGDGNRWEQLPLL